MGMTQPIPIFATYAQTNLDQNPDWGTLFVCSSFMSVLIRTTAPVVKLAPFSHDVHILYVYLVIACSSHHPLHSLTVHVI